MWKEFKNFVMRGNAVDLAIGIIIGVAFSAIVNSLVNDIIMPPIGLALGKVDFVNLFTVLKQGSTPLNYGFFVNTLISFLLIATVLFFIVKAMNTFKKREAASTKICPFCFTTINIKATKCPNCTSGLS
jgi:large conductance mechanosensitive channel